MCFIIILGAAGRVRTLDVEAETQRVIRQRNPLLAEFADPEVILSEAVLGVYGKLNDLAGFELESEGEVDLAEVLVASLSYGKTLLEKEWSEECQSPQKMQLAIDQKIRTSFDLTFVANKRAFDVIFSPFLLELLTEVQGQLAQDLSCQFRRETAKATGELTFDFYLSIFTDTQEQVLQRLAEWSRQSGVDVEDDTKTVVDVISNFRKVFLETRFVPIRSIAQLLKAPVHALKCEAILLLFRMAQGGHSIEAVERIALLVSVAAKLLASFPEEPSYVQIYIVAASLKSHFPAPEFQEAVDVVLAKFLDALASVGRQTKAIELLSNLAARKLGHKIQAIEHGLFLLPLLQSVGFPADLSGSPEQSAPRKLMALDMLTYLDSRDISPEMFAFATANLHDLFNVADASVATHNAPKGAFSDALIPIKTHLDYYHALYQLTLDLVRHFSLRNDDAWAEHILKFIDDAFEQKQFAPEIYLMLKVHLALYVPVGRQLDIPFRPFRLHQSPFRNDRFRNFRSILTNIYDNKSDAEDDPLDDLTLCHFFSGATFTANDFSFLKIRVQHSLRQEEEPAVRLSPQKMVIKVQDRSPVSRVSSSLPQRTASRQSFPSPEVPKRRAQMDGENLVFLLGGVMPPEDLAQLKRMKFGEWVRGKGLRMTDGDEVHEYVIVQRVRQWDICRQVYWSDLF